MDTLTTEARDALAATADADLLREFAHLTHRMGAARTQQHRDVIARNMARAQRDLIEAEVLRRMGGQS